MVEEEAIAFAESALRFSRHEVQTVASTLRHHSLSGMITIPQLAKVGQELDLQLTNSAPHTRIQVFLNKFKELDQEYKLEDWLVLGTMLSQGSAFTKAGLLFQVFCHSQQTLSLKVLREEVLPKMASFSLMLAKLVTNHQGWGAIEMKTSKFVHEMAQVQKTCIETVVQYLGLNGSQVTMDSFVRVMRTFRGGSLVNASGWRMYMHETAMKAQNYGECSTPTSTSS